MDGFGNPHGVNKLNRTAMASSHQKLWVELHFVIPIDRTPWTVIGDFNVLLYSSEKKGVRTIGKGCPLFNDFLEVSNLQDLGFKRPPFTWYRGGLSKRLDRAIRNDSWLRTFPNYSVIHLSKIKSDHRRLFLSLNPKVILPKGRPFSFTDNIKVWNNSIDGIIGVQKKYLMQRFGKIWNASFMSFFGNKKLGAVSICTKALPPSSFPKLSCDDEVFLRTVILDEEIKLAMFDMASLKAPGSDGFHALFFQSQWELVQNPEGFAQFRPISLCSVLYKLVIKIIANRFKEHQFFYKFRRLVPHSTVQSLESGFVFGVPLFYDRVTISSLKFVVDKVKSRLQSWDARQLSLADRATLAQSVLLTISTYFMQSLKIPQDICDEIESIVRQFI
ncbi:uncharacterized protein [Gossypium hirsutum]|uniref:Reverse transcriptase n=1 Tax=Gossypium hirsutum TaxID=3635 RepID=A0A1U8JMH0_GOSHI|nr:uncharacterized protein LOC107906880 [Gossypium hirsutum]